MNFKKKHYYNFHISDSSARMHSVHLVSPRPLHLLLPRMASEQEYHDTLLVCRDKEVLKCSYSRSHSLIKLTHMLTLTLIAHALSHANAHYSSSRSRSCSHSRSCSLLTLILTLTLFAHTHTHAHSSSSRSRTRSHSRSRSLLTIIV